MEYLRANASLNTGKVTIDRYKMRVNKDEQVATLGTVSADFGFIPNSDVVIQQDELVRIAAILDNLED